MPARNDTLLTEKDVWLLATDGAADEVTIQNQGSVTLWVIGLPIGASAPQSVNGAVQFVAGDGEKLVLADVFLGVDTPQSVWVMSVDFACKFMVSHA